MPGSEKIEAETISLQKNIEFIFRYESITNQNNYSQKDFFTFEGVPQFIANCISKINCLYKDRHMLKNGQHPYVIKYIAPNVVSAQFA